MSDSNIKFSDGVSFNTGGQYRLTRLSDGWYVVGRGLLAPVASVDDGTAFIAELEALDKLQGAKKRS